MFPRTASVLLAAIASFALPLSAAAPASATAKAKFRNCAKTANKGEQIGISVRVVTCDNAIKFLNSIASVPPGSVKQDGGDTVATVKTRGWVCVVRVPTADPSDPQASGVAHGTCKASKQRAIRWRTK